MKNKLKILFLDFETSPSLGYFWEMYETNIIEVIKHGYMLSASLKWLGEDKIYFYGLPDFRGYKKDTSNDRKLLEKILEFVDVADLIIAQNGDRFDLVTLNTRLVFHGMKPPHPSKTVDTLKVARSRFRFISNKLDDLGDFLGVGRKTPHTGKHLWFGCMNGDPKSWAIMKKYNVQDIRLLEKVYLKLRPFMTNHPNLAILKDDRGACPTCLKHRLTRSKIIRLRNGHKVQYQCRSCGVYWTDPKIIK